MKKTKIKQTTDVKSTSQKKRIGEAAGAASEPESVTEPTDQRQPERAQQPEEPADASGELRAEVARLEDSLLRARADYQNLLRRSANERAEAIRYANAELLRSLLGIVDDFERSLTAAESSERLDAVVEGVRLVYENLLKELRTHGLEAIEGLHQPFDPNVHEALMERSTSEYPSGTVVEEVAKGYRLHGRVLRPTKVVVSKSVASQAQPAHPLPEEHQADVASLPDPDAPS